MASGLKGLLEWSKRQVQGYPGVEVTNFTSSWRNGLAFCAMIHRYRPDLIDFHALKGENILENNELAFRTAEKELNIPALLDADDMVRMHVPDKLSIATYVSQYHNHLCKLTPAGGPAVHSCRSPVAASAEIREAGPGEKRPLPVSEREAGAGEKRPLSPDENEEPELRRKPTTQKPVPAMRQSLGDVCAHCGNKVYLLERHMLGQKLYHRVCYRRLHSHLPQSPISNYENSVLGANDRQPGVLNRPLSEQPQLLNGKSDPKNDSKPCETKEKAKPGLPSWLKGKGAKNKTSSGELPNNRLRLSDEHDSNRSAKLKENAVFNDLGVVSSMNNTSSGELDTESPDALHKQPVFPKVSNVGKNSPKQGKRREKRFLDFRSMSNDSLLVKKNTNLLKKEQGNSDSESGNSARARASAHWSSSSLDGPTSQRQSMTSQSSDSMRSPLRQSPSFTSESTQSFVPISALMTAEDEEDMPENPDDTIQDPNENTDPPTTEKTTIKPPIPVQPHFDPFDEVVQTPEREEKIAQAKSNTFVPNSEEKVPESKPQWLVKQDSKDGADDRDEPDGVVLRNSEKPEVVAESLDEYPEELNPFAMDDDDRDEREVSPPSAFVNASPFKSSTVRSIRTVASPRRKRTAPTLPPGVGAGAAGGAASTMPHSARFSLRSEPGLAKNEPRDRASLPAQMATLPPSTSPRRDKRPAPKPPVATPRTSLLKDQKNSDSLLKNNTDEHKDIKIVSNDLTPKGTEGKTVNERSNAPDSLPLTNNGTLKKVRVNKEFNFTRTSVDSDRESGSETEELLQQLDLTVDSPESEDRTIESIIGAERRKPPAGKKPAPPKPIPPKRKINLCHKVPTFEIEKELSEIDQSLTEMEARGRTMEDSIRLADEQASGEDETEMIRWFELVNEKNALIRREQELTYILREQDLEEDHEDIEHELRQLMAIQESLKSPEVKKREAELLEKLLQIVNERNFIVHNIDDDRIRYEEEDRVIAATMAESFSKQTLSSGGSPAASPKLTKKDKKEKKEKKEKKKKGGIFSCVASRKTSSTFQPSEKPGDKPEVAEDKVDEKAKPEVKSARKHGSTFYRDTDDVKI